MKRKSDGLDRLNHSLDNVESILKERHDDYVLIVKNRDMLSFRISEHTFAIGACDRVIGLLHRKDMTNNG